MDRSTKHQAARLAAQRLPALYASLALLHEDTAPARFEFYPAPRPDPGAPPHQASGVSITGTVTYDDSGHPVIVDAGTITETWTVTVTDAATGAVALSGASVGAVGTSNLGADLSPANPGGGVYFTLEVAGWGGTATTGDELTFTTTAVAPLVAIAMNAVAGTVNEGLFQIQLAVPVEGQITGADLGSGTETTWARIYDGSGDWWGDGSVSDEAGSGEIKLQTTLLYNGAFARLTSAVFQG